MGFFPRTHNFLNITEVLTESSPPPRSSSSCPLDFLGTPSTLSRDFLNSSFKSNFHFVQSILRDTTTATQEELLHHHTTEDSLRFSQDFLRTFCRLPQDPQRDLRIF